MGIVEVELVSWVSPVLRQFSLSLSFVSRKVERRRRRLIGLSEAPPAEGAAVPRKM